MTVASYRACSIKERRSRAEIEAIRETICAILKTDKPQTVRQVFYQLVTRGTIEKTEKEYQGTVIRLLSEMRLSGRIPWGWIIDESRRTINTQTFDNVRDALDHTAKHYRRSALRDCDVYIEIWSEKEALSGIIWDEAGEYDVPVVVSKGMPSLTQVYGSFLNIKRAARTGKTSFIYQFGDHDPTGCLIPKSIKARLCEFCDQHNCPYPIVERVALTEEQVEDYNLPTRPTKREGNTHAKSFAGDSVELDALPSNDLRELVRDCIERHISASQLETLRAAEESERDGLLLLSLHLDDDEAGL
jgi:DNA topoisomerase VI subunit A